MAPRSEGRAARRIAELVRRGLARAVPAERGRATIVIGRPPVRPPGASDLLVAEVHGLVSALARDDDNQIHLLGLQQLLDEPALSRVLLLLRAARDRGTGISEASVREALSPET